MRRAHLGQQVFAGEVCPGFVSQTVVAFDEVESGVCDVGDVSRAFVDESALLAGVGAGLLLRAQTELLLQLFERVGQDRDFCLQDGLGQQASDELFVGRSQRSLVRGFELGNGWLLS